jgi:hypothetical protein
MCIIGLLEKKQQSLRKAGNTSVGRWSRLDLSTKDGRESDQPHYPRHCCHSDASRRRAATHAYKSGIMLATRSRRQMERGTGVPSMELIVRLESQRFDLLSDQIHAS